MGCIKVAKHTKQAATTSSIVIKYLILTLLILTLLIAIKPIGLTKRLKDSRCPSIHAVGSFKVPFTAT